MHIFQKYLLKHLSYACVAVTGVLVGAVWITQSLRFVEVVFRKVDGQAAWVLFKLSFYLLPNLVVLLLPIGLAIGCLFSLHKLLDDREIVTLWAGGISNAQIAKVVSFIGLVAFGISFVFQAYISPLFVGQFRELERAVRQNISLSFIETGVFQDFGNITLYVQKKRDNKLFNILAYINSSENNKAYTLIAERGSFVKSTGAPTLLLENGIRQEKKESDGGKVSSLHFDRTVVEVAGPKKNDGGAFKKPSEYFLWDLFGALAKQESSTKYKFSSELHQRFLSPYLAFLFPYMVTFLLLARGFQRKGYGKRLGQAVVSVLVLQAIVLIAVNTTFGFVAYVVYGLLACITAYLYTNFTERTQ